MAKTIITKLYERIDRLCHDYYGTANDKVVEFVIRSNPGIEQYGILLPPGIEVILPDRPPAPDKVRTVMPNRLTLY